MKTESKSRLAPVSFDVRPRWRCLGNWYSRRNASRLIYLVNVRLVDVWLSAKLRNVHPDEKQMPFVLLFSANLYSRAVFNYNTIYAVRNLRCQKIYFPRNFQSNSNVNTDKKTHSARFLINNHDYSAIFKHVKFVKTRRRISFRTNHPEEIDAHEIYTHKPDIRFSIKIK